MATLASPAIRNFVGGAWQASASQPGLDLTNPATGEPLGQSPSGSAAEVNAAVSAAHAAFPPGALRRPAIAFSFSSS